MRAQALNTVTAERIERAMVLCAYLVARDAEGEVYAPILERLETEMIQARAAEKPTYRARRILDAYVDRPAREKITY